MDFNEFFRYILLFGSVVICIINAVSLLVSFKYMSRGQIFFVAASMFYVAYNALALKEAIDVQLDFRPRLILLVVGEMMFLAYMLEPIELRKARRGAPMMGGKDDPGYTP